MPVIIEDPVTLLRKHDEGLLTRLRDTEQLLRAVLLTVCRERGGPVAVDSALILGPELPHVQAYSDPMTQNLLLFVPEVKG